jgi:hypothetical protein
MFVKPEGKRKKSRSRMRWMDGMEKDLRNLGVVNWKKQRYKDGGAGEIFRAGLTHKELCQ